MKKLESIISITKSDTGYQIDVNSDESTICTALFLAATEGETENQVMMANAILNTAVAILAASPKEISDSILRKFPINVGEVRKQMESGKGNIEMSTPEKKKPVTKKFGKLLS